MNMFNRGVCAGLLMLVCVSAGADNLSGARNLICTALQATFCTAAGDCESGQPWSWNIPQFIQVDLRKKTLSTTPASGENRVTPIRSTERKDGLIILQGAERGRAFSFVIDEMTGVASVAVAREGITVSVFGACTPDPK